MIRKSAVAHKQQGKGARSTLEVVPKVALKRKNDAKDDRLPKKGTSPFVGSQQQKSLLPVHHEVGKGLSRVHTRCFQFDNFRVHPNLRHFYLFILGVGADEGPPGHIHGQRWGHPSAL